MKKNKIVLTVLSLVLIAGPVLCQTAQSAMSEELSDSLLVIWTSADKEVARNMVFMYVYNAKKNKWWGQIRFLIWGPSAKILAGDEDLQAELAKMKDTGVELFACKACADRYGVGEKLTSLGVTVKYTGTDLTEWLKAGWTSLTF